MRAADAAASPTPPVQLPSALGAVVELEAARVPARVPAAPAAGHEYSKYGKCQICDQELEVADECMPGQEFATADKTAEGCRLTVLRVGLHMIVIPLPLKQPDRMGCGQEFLQPVFGFCRQLAAFLDFSASLCTKKTKPA